MKDLNSLNIGKEKETKSISKEARVGAGGSRKYFKQERAAGKGIYGRFF